MGPRYGSGAVKELGRCPVSPVGVSGFGGSWIRRSRRDPGRALRGMADASFATFHSLAVSGAEESKGAIDEVSIL